MQTVARNFDVTVVGHLSIDTILLPSRTAPFVVLGGAATYTSFAARLLDSSVCVISRVGGSFPEAYLWWLRQEGIDVSNVTKKTSDQTTCFELNYAKNLARRTLKLKSKGKPLSLNDLPSDFHTKACHVAPIANEVSYKIIKRLRESCDVISIDPQGLLRSFDKKGNVTENASVDKKIFALVNVYKSSQNEIYALTGKSKLKPAVEVIHDLGVETVIVTNGAKGTILSLEGAQYKIPSCKAQVLVDPTGAGDVFIGGFLAEYLREKDVLWSACVGSAAASFVVEGIGPTFFSSKENIYRRATDIFKKKI